MTCEHVVHFLTEPCRGSRLEIPALFQFVGMKAQACLNMCDFCQMTPTVSDNSVSLCLKGPQYSASVCVWLTDANLYFMTSGAGRSCAGTSSWL